MSPHDQIKILENKLISFYTCDCMLFINLMFICQEGLSFYFKVYKAKMRKEGERKERKKNGKIQIKEVLFYYNQHFSFSFTKVK